MFERLGATIYRHRWLTLILAGAFLLVSVGLLLRGGKLTGGTIRDIEYERAEGLVEAVLGHPQDNTFVAVFQSPDLDPEGEAFQAAMAQALDPVRADPNVLSVVTPDTAPPFLAARMVNRAERAAFALVSLKGTFKEAIHEYGDVRAKLRSDQLTITCTGRAPFLHDLGITLAHDLKRAELISLPLALLVLLLVFRTAVAAALPVGVGALAVVGGIAIVLGLSHSMDIAEYTVNVCSLIGLGVAIDYSLFTVARYREELAGGHDYPKALERAMATAGRVVAFSGLAVGTGLAGLLFFEGSYLSAMGVGGAIVVCLAVVFALTFLPALLAVLGPKIQAGRLRLGRGHRLEDGFWHRTANWVMRRPVRILIPTLGLLLFMGVPFLHLRLTTSDVRVLPEEAEARRGYELLRTTFPDQAKNRILVAVSFPTEPALTPERVGAIYDLSRRIAAIPHVSGVDSIVDAPEPLPKEAYQTYLTNPPALYAPLVEAAKRMTVGKRVVLLYAKTEKAPESPEARDIVRAIRSERGVGDGSLVVGGQTALDIDSTEFILSRTPYAVAFVVGVTLIVLFLLLGSVLLPIKAVLMNFVSIAGSFGALVWIFQDGNLFIREARPLEPSLPVLLFCILFGLSMDYEVLMLSRIKESYDRTGDNTHAVADGLERTAGLITSAAAIMVAVFSAFALARVVLIQAVGFGMALAVALDATLVRVLLVPATIRLLGHLNWWAPRFLTRFRWLVRPSTHHHHD